MANVKKDLTALRKAATKAGWRIEPTAGKKGHEWWISPSGERILTGTTLSDHNGLKNHLSRLRRAGWTG
jgi:hypothetical protein